MKDSSLDSTDLTWLAGLARALLGEAHAADDLVQETAVAALQGSMPLGAPRRAWLGSVARRLAARRFRGEARREQREELVARAEALPDSAELVERAETAEQVTAAARRLPEPFRRTILLRFLEGRSAEEIAREESKPADTVRYRVRRGLELLREDLVRKHDRDWNSWCVLLLPLARSRGAIGVATAGAAGVSTGMFASLTAMKVTMAMAAAVGCLGLWLVRGSGDEAAADAGVEVTSVSGDNVESAPTAVPDPSPSPVETETTRTNVTAPPATEESVAADPEPTGDLVGEVVDEDGRPVAEAKVFLVPSVGIEAEERDAAGVIAQTESDWQGAFRIAAEDWSSELALDLGVSANGFRRQFVADVTGERVLVVLERGRTLSGRVLDESGRPVPGLELLAHSAYAGVDHVSPSQRLLRAKRKELSNASSAYDQCRATTNGRGEVVFTGLPTGDLEVLPLEPGWTLEEPRVIEENETYIEWTAKQRLGVRLDVIDVRTGQPVDRAAATFRFGLTFEDGVVQDLGQWSGRGNGEVTFALGDESLFGFEERTIVRATFYGTVRSGESERVDWMAEAIEDPYGAVGVAKVRVELDPAPAPEAESPVELATLDLDVRYDDSAPFEGELIVRWVSRTDSAKKGKSYGEAVGLGRYHVEVPAGDWTLTVADRRASGFLPAWADNVSCRSERAMTVYATLPRGATATITRPDGWNGTWRVHASWRPDDTEEWLGSMGYGTDQETLTLTALRPAEWRFALSRDAASESDPLVRTVFLAEGESAVVDR